MSPSECTISLSGEPISPTISSTNWSKQSSRTSLAFLKLIRRQARPSRRMRMKNTFMPFHPGAVRYYREIGTKIPETLVSTN